MLRQGGQVIHRHPVAVQGLFHSGGGIAHIAMHRLPPVSSRPVCMVRASWLARDRCAPDAHVRRSARGFALVSARGGVLDIRSGQKLAWENKVEKGFNTTDVPLEFCLLQGEVAEAFDAWRKNRGSAGEELADVAIYLLSLAEMMGVDLQGEVEAKIVKNASRAYTRLPNGVLVKDGAKAGT